MARVCVRPGCDHPARARLAYDVVGCQVWIDQVGDQPGPSQEICELHLSRLTVPRGWMICDRRGDAPALFIAESPSTASDGSSASGRATTRPTGRPGRRRRSAESDTPDLVLFSHDDPSDDPDPSLGDGGERTAPDTTPDATPGAEPAAVGPDPAEAARAGSKTVESEPARTDSDDSEPAGLKVSSPLLARAFATTGPQRSVLTHFLEDQAEARGEDSEVTEDS